jgi:hypothetical protein
MQLNIRIQAGRSFPKMDVVGTVDPFVVMELVGSPVTHQTTVLKNAPLPSWNEEFSFQLIDPWFQVLHFFVRDKDLLTDEDIGVLDFPLKDIPFFTCKSGWFPVQPAKGVTEVPELLLDIFLGMPGPITFQDQTPPEPDGDPPYAFHLRFIEADGFEGAGKTDASVMFTIGGERYMTNLLKGERVAPGWEEDFHPLVPDVKNNLVWFEMNSGGKVARCSIQTSIFPIGHEFDTWLDLWPNDKGKKTGRLHLRMQIGTASRLPFGKPQ